MPYCHRCGTEVSNTSYQCSECNTRLHHVDHDTAHKFKIGLFFLGAFVPILGFALYLIWRKKNKVDARSALFGALACVLFYVFVFVYAVILGFGSVPYYY